MRQSQYSQPYFVSGLRESDRAIALPRVRLSKTTADAESQVFRLQSFIMRHPTVLPIGEIEQALVSPVPVCMELPTRSNLFIDNLFVTPNGDLILVECKLWHNYESRRDVWPAPGSEDTELGVLIEPEVGHGEAEVYTGVQA